VCTGWTRASGSERKWRDEGSSGALRVVRACADPHVGQGIDVPAVRSLIQRSAISEVPAAPGSRLSRLAAGSALNRRLDDRDFHGVGV
jgi:hypothetical protein